MSLTHFDAKGDAHMVDVTDKAVTDRVAVAEGHISMAPETFDIVAEGRAKKGDVLAVALRCSGFLVHLRSLMAAMNQKSSVTKKSNLSHRR